MVELMVAMVLVLFLLLALTQILISGRDSFGASTSLSRLQENGRIATDLLITHLKRAGYMGGNSDIPNIYGNLGQETPDSSCDAGDTTWARMVTRPLEGLDDTNGGYACINNGTYLRGDVVTVRYTSPWIETGALDPDKLYLRSSLFEGRIFAGSDEGLAINQVADEPQSVRELQAFAYFVGDSGRTCNGARVPSLFRVRVNDKGQPITEELLPGVEDLQIQFGIVTGTTTTSIPGGPTTTVSGGGSYLDPDDVSTSQWPQINVARVWLLVRSECAETGYVDNATYNMGNRTYTPNDNFRRQLYSNVVNIRNFKN